jgi:hypothetical protein
MLLCLGAAPPIPEAIREVPLARSKPTPNPLLNGRWTYDEAEQVSGNAAPYWVRMTIAIRRVNQNWGEIEYSKIRAPLSADAKKKLQAVVDKHADAYKQSAEAAKRTHCHWESPAMTLTNLADGTAVRFDELQAGREMANLLSLRANLALVEKRWDDARQDLRIGLTMASHLADGKSLLSDLVGIAITSVLMDVVYHWISIPDSPNLYWSLTELPEPWIDTRKSIRHELNTIYRSVPLLLEMKKRSVSDAEVQLAFRQFIQQSKPLSPLEAMQWQGASVLLQLTRYPQARDYLLKNGYGENQVKALGKMQTLAMQMLHEYDAEREPILQALCLPTHQGLPRLEEWAKEHKKRVEKTDNLFLRIHGLSTPSFIKVWHAQARLERLMVTLRAVELLRAQRKFPAKWAELDSGLIDPVTGKPLDDWYHLEENRAVLHMPSPMAVNQRKFLLPREAGTKGKPS